MFPDDQFLSKELFYGVQLGTHHVINLRCTSLSLATYVALV